MSDEQRLLAVIAAIYLADCIYWIPRRGLGFTKWLGAVWNFHAPSTIFGNDRGAFGFANPLPPLGMATRAVGWTISFVAKGVYAHSSAGFNAGARPGASGSFFTWEEIKKIERDGKRIFINGAPFSSEATEYSAQRVAKELGRLQKMNGNKRAAEMQAAVERCCDVSEVKRIVANFLKQTVALRICGNALFFFLFAACPYLVWRYTFVGALWPMLIGMYAQTILIALLFSRLHGKFYPNDHAQIFKPFLTMLLAAPSAIRAQDILARPLLEPFHPLAVAKAIGSERDFENLAGVIMRDLKFPRLPITLDTAGETAREVECAFRTTLLDALGRKLSLAESKWLRSPEKTEAVHVSYCPRCLQQFTQAATQCPDCGGRALVKFDSAA